MVWSENQQDESKSKINWRLWERERERESRYKRTKLRIWDPILYARRRFYKNVPPQSARRSKSCSLKANTVSVDSNSITYFTHATWELCGWEVEGPEENRLGSDCVRETAGAAADRKLCWW